MTRPRAPLCAVRIGIYHWLMPEPQAMKVFSALRAARRVELVAVSERDIIKPQTRTPKLIEG